MVLQTPAMPTSEEIVLDDSSSVVIRPIRPDDAAYLQSTFLRLSTQSIYFRFMTHKRQLTDEEARQYAEVDYTTRMAFVATCQVEGMETVVGVARYALLDASQPDTAEAAVIVRDDYQGRGLGRHLLWRLVVYARQVGIMHLRASVLLENNRILGIIQRGGLPFQKRYIEGLWEITVDLGD